MATINDIVNLDNYKGDVAAGGGDAGAFNIDTRPLQQLGLYTNFYNKTVYDQTIQDRDKKIKEISAIADIDLNNLYGKDKELITKNLANLTAFATEYAKNPNITVQDQLKWQTALGTVQNDYMSGKQRSLAYHAQLNDINTNHSGAEKDILTNELNEKFNSTDISTPISTGTGYKPVAVDVPPPQTIEGNNLLNMANSIVDAKWSVYNPSSNAALASSTVLGLNNLRTGLTGTSANLQDIANGAAQQWAGMTNAFNATITAKNVDGTYKYFDAQGNFDANKFQTENASNTAVMQPYNALVNLNQYSTQKKNEVAQGVYSDKGITYKAPPNLTPNMFDAGIINFSPDGITPDQLVQAGMFQKYVGDRVVKTFKETGLGISQQNANTATGRLNEEIRSNKANEAINKQKADAAAGNTTTPENQFGNLIYGVNLPNFSMSIKQGNQVPANAESIKDGAIVDKDGNVVTSYSGTMRIPVSALNNSILSEYQKYAGSKTVEKSDGLEEPTTTTTTVSGSGKIDTNGGVNLRFENGIINGIQAEDGSFIDDNQFANITQTAAQKGVTKYKKADTGYGSEKPSEYIQTVIVKGVKWGKKADGTIEKIN